MMIVELIDQDDFREHLAAAGIPVPAGADPDEAARIALRASGDGDAPLLEETVTNLMRRRDVMHPSVRDAIETHLLPSMPGAADAS